MKQNSALGLQRQHNFHDISFYFGEHLLFYFFFNCSTVAAFVWLERKESGSLFRRFYLFPELNGFRPATLSTGHGVNLPIDYVCMYNHNFRTGSILMGKLGKKWERCST